MAASHPNPQPSSAPPLSSSSSSFPGSGSKMPSQSILGVTTVDVNRGDNSVYSSASNNNNITSPFSSDASLADLYSLLMLSGALPNGIDPEDQEYMSKLTHYLMGIGGSIVCCMGTIANAMSVAVLTRPVMKSSTYMYLAALAVCDSLVLFFTLLLVLKDTKPPDSPHQLNTFHAILYPFVHPTAIVFQVTSIWLTLAFTVDRYIMICHPFQAEHMCRKSRARLVVVGIYIGGFVFNIPKYLENYTKTDEFKIANSTQVYKTYGVMTTDIGNNELFRKIVHSWGYLVFVCGIPFLTLVILNAFLIRAVRESRLKGKEINPKEKHRNDTTVMLIGVIIIFLICQGPALVSRMTYAFKPGTTRNRAEFTLNEVASFLVILNSAINIVPYYLFGRKFRSEFWRIFCSCFLDKDEMRRIVRSYSVSIDHRRMSNYNVMEMNGMGPSKSHNDMAISHNSVQRCGTGTTVTASLSSNLNDETSPLNITPNNNIGNCAVLGVSGDGGGTSSNSGSTSSSNGGQHLALPQIHNSHHHHHQQQQQHHHRDHNYHKLPSSASSQHDNKNTANLNNDTNTDSNNSDIDVDTTYVVLNNTNYCDYAYVDDATNPTSSSTTKTNNYHSNNDSDKTSHSFCTPRLQSPSTFSSEQSSYSTSSYCPPPIQPLLSSAHLPPSSSTSNTYNSADNGRTGHRGKYMSISTNHTGGGSGAKSDI